MNEASKVDQLSEYAINDVLPNILQVDMKWVEASQVLEATALQTLVNSMDTRPN